MLANICSTYLSGVGQVSPLARTQLRVRDHAFTSLLPAGGLGGRW